MDWGWRLPFIASIVLIGISMYVQLRLEDTEAFKGYRNPKMAKRVISLLLRRQC